MNLRFIPVSPDGFPFGYEPDFATKEEAEAYIPTIIRQRYTKQGYYSTSNRERLTLDEAIAACRVISYDASDYEDEVGNEHVMDAF